MKRNTKRSRRSSRPALGALCGLLALILLGSALLIARVTARPAAVAAAEAGEDVWDFGDEDWPDGEDEEAWPDALEDAEDAEEADFGAGPDDGFSAFGDDGEIDGEGWNDDGLLGGLLDAEGSDTVVAEFDGGTITLAELAEPYNERIAFSDLAFGGEADGALLEEVVRELAADEICRLRAEALGLDAMTEADQEAVDALADEAYGDYARMYGQSLNLTGLDEGEREAEIAAFLKEELGVSREGLRASISERYWMNKLFDEVTSGVTVSEDEVQAAYERRLAEQREDFEAYPQDFDYSVMEGEVIAWNPSGYRRVRHILLAFEDNETARQAEALTDEIAQAQLNGEGVDAILALQAKLDALYTDLDARAEDLLAQLNAGADFDALLAEYGQDPRMEEEPWKSRGYPVGAESLALYSQDFIDACLALETPGQISFVAHSPSGAHLIRYEGDLTPGAVPLSEIREGIAAEALDDARGRYFEEEEARWIEEANLVIYPERMQ